MARHEAHLAFGGTVSTARGAAIIPSEDEGMAWHQVTCQFFEFTARDMVAARMSQKWWSLTGLRVLKPRNITQKPPAVVYVYGLTVDGLMRSTGVIDDVESANVKALGVFAHTVWSSGGFSGSPVIARRAGGDHVIGMHICGNVYDKNANYAITSGMVMTFFKDCGLFEPRVGIHEMVGGRKDADGEDPGDEYEILAGKE